LPRPLSIATTKNLRLHQAVANNMPSTGEREPIGHSNKLPEYLL
jgi:hypothetical protein